MSTLKYRDSNNDYQGFYVKVTDTLPVGSVYLWGGITAPSGYLICDGRAVSRTEYADLFKAIGTNFGLGDGLTTFNIPDYRGKVPVGLDGSDVDFDTIGKTFGEKKHTLTIDEIPSHNHSLFWGTTEGGSGNSIKMGVNYEGLTSSQMESTGGGQAHNICQPSLVTNYIIKASNKVALERGNVVDSLTGEDTDSAPSVRAVKEALAENYSTDEVKTNKVWIDGKPIYRKVIRVSGHPTNITHNISNLDKVIDTRGYILRSESTVINMSFPHIDTNTAYVVDVNYYDTTNINMIYGNTIVTLITGLVLVLEYTKTTD